MKALLIASIGGVAAFLIMYWSMEFYASGSQDDATSSALNGATRLSSGVQADKPAVDAGSPDREAGDVQALVDRILGRPLFNADRRPANTRAAGPAGLPRLTAVLVSSNGKIVIFAGGAAGKSVALTEGASIGNYVVRSIVAGQVTVSGPNGVQVLRPTPDSSAQAAMPPVVSQLSITDLLRQNAPAVGVLRPPLPAQR